MLRGEAPEPSPTGHLRAEVSGQPGSVLAGQQGETPSLEESRAGGQLSATDGDGGSGKL